MTQTHPQQLLVRFLELAAASTGFIMLLCFTGWSGKPTEGTNESVSKNSVLFEELLRRAKEDQAIRPRGLPRQRFPVCGRA
jgi:hypothetical protein